MVEEFLSFLELEQRSPRNTLEAYKNDLIFWKDVFGSIEDSSAFSKASILAALKKLNASEFKESTQHRKRAVLRSYLRFLAYKDNNLSAFLDLIPLPLHEEPLPKALDKAEIESLLSCIENSTDIRSERDSVFANLLYSSGLRISEALTLSWRDIDEQREVLRVHGKGAKERFVPYSARSSKALNKYHKGTWQLWNKKFPKNDKIFITPRSSSLTRMGAWKNLSHWSQKAGLGHIHPHVLRHSFATHLLAGGADVRIVQSLLGHTSLNTTERYLKIDDSEVRKLFEEYHPLG
ncbi:MAG: tyrosine-type recombinase/integrase [Bdellovibrionota bacterium]